MVIRCGSLMGVPGGLYVACSWLALPLAILGLHGSAFLALLGGLCLAISFLLGWLIDQQRWWMPVVFAERYQLDELAFHEANRARIHCLLAGVARSVALGMLSGWLFFTLRAAAAGGPW